MQRLREVLLTTVFLIFLWSVPQALAHAHGAASISSGVDMHTVSHSADDHSILTSDDAETTKPPANYFHHPEHAGVISAHIIVMLLAWIIVLPSAVMLSIGRSRLSLAVQILFHMLNALGIFASIAYNTQTPDLYENNAHHKSGWAISFVVVAWTLMGIVTLYADKENDFAAQPVSREAMAEHHSMHEGHQSGRQRWSHDSGQGTERNTDSLFMGSRANSWQGESGKATKHYHDDSDDDEAENQSFLHHGNEKRSFLQNNKLDIFLSRAISHLGSGRHMTILKVFYVLLERFMAFLAFLAIVTGAVTYSGVFRDGAIFGGLAHIIKGGIFFWYGLLTLGRWMGCFSDFGWAWNLKPGADVIGRARSRIPSAEFTESLVICLYGASNVFLEHLSGWGGEWTPMDLEHISITIMFFGGGLLGMLVESRSIRRLLNGTLLRGNDSFGASSPVWKPPRSYVHSLNPMPALVILLLGIMMSSHHQHSAISAAIHGQWGTMFVGFALARWVTYITFWLKPPESYLPSRPPSEIITSFCLVSGGILFMASNGDTVDAIESHGLDAMFVFTVVMGMTGMIMAWAFAMVAIKSWATRRHRCEFASVQIPISRA